MFLKLIVLKQIGSAAAIAIYHKLDLDSQASNNGTVP